MVGTLQGRAYLEERSAFVWDPSSGLRALGQFAGEATFGEGITDRGVVTGVAGGGHVYFPGTPFRWTAAGGFESLEAFGTPEGINNAGAVVGSGPGPGWVRWDASGRVQPFSSAVYGSPLAISNSGHIVGFAPGGGPAQFFDPQTGLGQLPAFPGGFSALAYDINDLGHATGVADVPTPPSPSAARLAAFGRPHAQRSGATADRRRSDRTSATATASTTTTT
jgi:hypothetical protein